MAFLMKYKIVDMNNKEIKVGDEIRLVDLSRDAEVVGITEPDIDYNDEAQRPVMMRPEVTVRLSDSGLITIQTEDETKVTWADYPDGPDEYVFGLETFAVLKEAYDESS